MSVDWGVVPTQPDEPSIQEWLTSAGLKIPPSRGRFPTFDELINVLQSFDGVPIQQEAYGESSYNISLGAPYSKQSACILGSIEDGYFRFHFFGSSNQEITMLEILKRLAGVCGPLILYENIAATPVIVESSTSIENELEDWRRRSQQRYSGNMAE